jgi:anaerobic ribonucleoside-triphosphate reductase
MVEVKAEANPPAEDKDVESKRTKCEVYSRIVGYLRPVSQWNAGKQAEFKVRKMYEVKS